MSQYVPDCADCPTPDECKAKNDCQVLRQIRHPGKSRPQSRSDGDLSFDELRAMYDAQCACTDEWVAKYEAEKEKKASANLLNRIAELKSQLADVNQRLAAANEQLTARSENRPKDRLLTLDERLQKGIDKTAPKDPRPWIDRLRDDVAAPSSERATVLEEAALECQRIADIGGGPQGVTRATALWLRDNIRALKDKPASAKLAQVPEGWALVPAALTAENGMKFHMSGDWSVRIDEEGHEVVIPWDTIKQIHRDIVERSQRLLARSEGRGASG